MLKFMNPADQRVRRTRQQLKESFITLVNERGFDAVTIRDITNHADVGYRTFFRHYKDPKELMTDALEEFVAEVKQVLLPPESLEITERNVITMFEFIEKNVDLFRVLYRSPDFEVSVGPLADFGRRVGQVSFVPSYIPQPILDAHFLGSMMNLQRWWVENGMPIPAKEMGRYAHDLVVRPLLELDGIYPISAD